MQLCTAREMQALMHEARSSRETRSFCLQNLWISGGVNCEFQAISNMDDQVSARVIKKLNFSTLFCFFLLHNDIFYLYYLNLQKLGQLEVLCKQLYESTDAAVRGQAEKALISFTESPDCLQKCQYVLERGTVSLHILKSLFLVLLPFDML